MHEYPLKDYLNSINLKQGDLSKDERAMQKYPAFVVNKCLSSFIDTVMHANEMNRCSNLPAKMQYDFFINTVRPRKRFSPWEKKDTVENLDLVKKYYGYSIEKARQALSLLSPQQIDYIKNKLNTGGTG